MINKDEVLGAQVLIVDDEPTNVTLLEQLLAKEGYRRVVSVTDPLKANAVFLETSPDIVLLDLNMPGLSGMELMATFRNTPTGVFLPILVLTADPTTRTKLAALKGGATDFLSKPLDLTEVLLRIRNLLEMRMLHQRLDEWNATLEDRVRLRTQALQETLLKLRAAENIRDLFIQNVSHELRTPLTPIMGWAQTIIDRDLPPEGIREGAQTILNEAERLVRVVNSLIRVASIRAHEMDLAPDLLDVRQLILRVTEKARAEGRKFEVSIQPGAQELAADERYVGEILEQLVDNAQKFSPKDTPIEISVEQVGQEVRFTISDHGVGVADEDREAIFDYFTQADPSTTRVYGGLGAGLYIAHELVSAHRGRLSVRETPGGGATFIFTIPSSTDLTDTEA